MFRLRSRHEGPLPFVRRRPTVHPILPVDDMAAAIEFYRQLGEEGRSRAEALQVAQRSILEQRAYRHPIYWAPYMLVSSWL